MRRPTEGRFINVHNPKWSARTMMMQLTTLLLLLCTVSSFTLKSLTVVQQRTSTPIRFPLFSSSTEIATNNLPIIVNGHNIALTPALVEHVNKRIGGVLSKLATNGAVRECDVVLSVSKNPKVQ
jgi:hypothetical protein